MSDDRPVDEWLLVVGSYATADEPGIHVFGPGPSWEPNGTFTGVDNPSWVSANAEATHLYAVSERDERGAVHAFDFDPSDRPLIITDLGGQQSHGGLPCHLALHPSGRWLVVSNYASGTVAVLPVGPDGGLGETSTIIAHEGSGPIRARQQGPHAHASVFSPDGGWLLVADLGIDRIVVYAVDDERGTLTRHSHIATRPGAGPRLLAFHGSLLLAVNELDNTLTAYDWHEGTATQRSTVPTVPDGEGADSLAAGLAVSASGDHAYVTNRGHDSVAVIEIDEAKLIATHPCGGRWPRSCALTPDGAHLLIANQHSDRVSVLPVTKDGVDVGAPIHELSVPSPSSLAFVPRRRP